MINGAKTQQEIYLVKESQKITDSVFLKILPYLKAGVSEKEIADIINAMLLSSGAEETAFETIVGFGAGSCEPHHVPRADFLLKENDIILLDFGAKRNGYCSDMSRTLAIGETSEKFLNAYRHVLKAQETAIKKLKAGIVGKDGDSIARNYLKKQNLDKFFTHGLGHSIGKAVHEPPNLNQKEEGIIPVNALCTVEPGVYFEGEFGVRIEDIVLFKETSVENLTKTDKKLIILQ